MTSTIEIKGGEKLAAFLKKVSAQKARVDIGFFETSEYGNGTKVAQVAVWQEYGTHDAKEEMLIPPRPFLHPTYEEQKGKWLKVLQQAIKKQGEEINVEKALTAVGFVAVDDVRKKIDWWAREGEPRNAEFTIEKKGFDSPLVESGIMRDAVKFEVTIK